MGIFGRKKQGIWQTRGHGVVLNITPFLIELYEISQAGAVRSLRIPASHWLFSRLTGVSLVRVGEQLHLDTGGLAPVIADRIAHLPANIIKDSDPETVFEVFWHAMNEHYAFFELYGVDWAARYGEFRPKVTPTTTDDDLFNILTQALTGIDDRHVSLQGQGRAFSPGKKPAWITMEKMGQQVLPYNAIIDRYLQGEIQRTGTVVYGWLTDDIAYVRFDRMKTSGKTTIQATMQQIAQTFQRARSIIVDVRHNPGGSDDYALAIASFFTQDTHIALTKATRSGDGYTKPDTITLAPYGAARLTMPVYLLTSAVSFSAAETFAWLMTDLPQVTVVGERSGGGFSDILERKLPNGWLVGLSNQRYTRPDGTCYEGVGIPVDIERVVDVNGFAAGKDSLLEEIMALEPLSL